MTKSKLPVIVISGKPGTGKTMACEAIQKEFNSFVYDPYGFIEDCDVLILDGHDIKDIIISKLEFKDFLFGFDFKCLVVTCQDLKPIEDKLRSIGLFYHFDFDGLTYTEEDIFRTARLILESSSKKEDFNESARINPPVFDKPSSIYSELPKFDLKLDEHVDKQSPSELYLKSALSDAMEQYNASQLQVQSLNYELGLAISKVQERDELLGITKDYLKDALYKLYNSELNVKNLEGLLKDKDNYIKGLLDINAEYKRVAENRDQ